jgi:purine-binding chemotaxis protein CheW
MIDAMHTRPGTASAAQAGVPTQYLTFTLGGETFAIGILAVKEIIEYTALTDVPMMSPSIRGVINLRGAVVTVMDLSVCFGRAATPVTKRTCIIIVEVGGDAGRQVIGVVVDAVNAVLEIAASEIEPAPTFGAHIRNDFIEGMGKIGGRFVILLDIARVFADLRIEHGAAAPHEEQAAR